MKTINVFLLIMFIYAIKCSLTEFEEKKCEDYEPNNSGDNHAFSLDFCRTTSYDTSSYAACCFVKWESSGEKREYNCYRITPTLYADMDEAETAFKKLSNAEDIISIDCSASYLYGSLLLILALLF